MFERLSDLREPLFAARLLREEVFLAPLTPLGAKSLERWCRARNGRSPASAAALRVAGRLAAEDDVATVRAEHLLDICRAAGGSGLRRGPGDAFQGTPAPPPTGVGNLLDELLETVNAPVAVEVWPPPARAFALHFLLRLVQPFDADPAPLAHAAEALLLSADGFEVDRLLLPPPAADEIGRTHVARPDPDAFALDRAHRLLESVAETRDVQREWTARGVLLARLGDRSLSMGVRPARLLRWLAEGPVDRALRFEDYVGLHAGRGAPSLRSLQRDWKALVDAGFLVRRDDVGDAHTLSVAPLAYDRAK